MNERIKELVEQTARELVYEHDDDIGGVMDVWKFQNKDIEKFAELIVKECIQYLTDEAERLYSLRNDDGDLCAAKCYDNIEGLKEHFGVEE